MERGYREPEWLAVEARGYFLPNVAQRPVILHTKGGASPALSRASCILAELRGDRAFLRADAERHYEHVCALAAEQPNGIDSVKSIVLSGACYFVVRVSDLRATFLTPNCV